MLAHIAARIPQNC